MKKFFLYLTPLFFILIASCNAQPKSDYEIYSTPVIGASKYYFFLEKKSAASYKLVQGADYLSPDLTSLKIGEASSPSFTVSLPNDGSEYAVGIVAVNSAGFYSGLGVFVGSTGYVPNIPAGVGFKKK